MRRTLWLLAFICLIDAIGFGIMIPLIYSYGKQFGLNKMTLGLLTAAFSVAQFFATPLLGALSDKIGRKLLLIICLAGTCASFVLFGLAGSLLMLFAARILDGLTGGDISVAQAMVADISPSAQRAKNFGILGSAFGLGYVIGPAIGDQVEMDFQEGDIEAGRITGRDRAAEAATTRPVSQRPA